MRMDLRGSGKQLQGQQLSANVIYSIRLLSLNNMELSRYLDEQIQENPMLEILEERDEVPPGEEADWAEFMKNTYAYGENAYLPAKELPEITDQGESLKDVLLGQLHCLNLGEVERFIGEWLIDYVDENGYLKIAPIEVATFFQVPLKMVNRLVKKIQGFEPSGVGALNLGESLSIQLRAKGIEDETIHLLVLDHLDDLAHHKEKLMSSLEISEETLQEYLQLIRRLNPKPGLAYSVNEPALVVPDLLVDWSQGRLSVRLNRYQLPKLAVSSYYKSILEDGVDPKTREFIEGRMESAKLLLNALRQRDRTILAVSRAIFERQLGFLERGDAALAPLTMKEVAEMVDVHESTVSRAVKNKYILCKQGIYPLRHFFQARLAAEDDGGMSSAHVKEMLRRMVRSENKTNPYSDQKLAEMLGEEGCPLSRRTVAKYREQMKIPSSRERKECL